MKEITGCVPSTKPLSMVVTYKANLKSKLSFSPQDVSALVAIVRNGWKRRIFFGTAKTEKFCFLENATFSGAERN